MEISYYHEITNRKTSGNYRCFNNNKRKRDINVNDKMTKAKIGVILEQPFFATLILKKQFVEDLNVNKFATDGNIIKYNPKFVETATYDELKAGICRVAMHTALLHPLRREGRDSKQWNTACEYAVNPLLKNSGIHLPSYSLIDSKYSDLSSEEIYRMRYSKSNLNSPGNSLSDETNDFLVEVQDPSNTSKSLTEQEAEVKQSLAQALLVAKQQGKVPSHLELLINEILNPLVPWKEVLSRFLTEPAKNDYSFSKPNLRFLHTGFILPSLNSLDISEVYLIIDTSGSISNDLLNQFAGELQDVCSSFNCKITVLYVNNKVVGVESIEPDDIFKLSPVGGGGTDFVPGFDWLSDKDITPTSLVYLTDGLCNSFPDAPDYPVLWCVYNNKKFDPPFGETVKVYF